MRIYCAGGSGEKGRSAYLLTEGEHSLLLDFGVQRLFSDSCTGKYPHIDGTLLKTAEGVLLSHAHEDHSAALPLLTRQGLDLPVYCHPLTAALTPDYCRAWLKAVQRANFPLPYTDADIAAVPFITRAFGEKFRIGPFGVEMGPSGHMPGSAWILITVGNYKLLYTGDLCWENLLLRPPVLPTDADAVIINSAYGGAVLRQAKQREALYQKIAGTISRGGIALLPVPRVGRGHEIMADLLTGSLKNTPLYVDAAIVETLRYYLDYREGLSPEGKRILSRLDISNLPVLPAESLPQATARPAIVIVPDAMLSGGASRRWVEALAGDPDNLVLFTGYLSPGTLGARLLAGERSIPREGGEETIRVEAAVEKVTWKAHPDAGDLCAWVEPLPKDIELFLGHCEVRQSGELIEKLRRLGFSGRILPVGTAVELRGA